MKALLGYFVLVLMFGAILFAKARYDLRQDRDYPVVLHTWFGYSNKAEIKGENCVPPRTGIAEKIDTEGVWVKLIVRTPYIAANGCRFKETRSWLREQERNLELQKRTVKYLKDVIHDNATPPSAVPHLYNFPSADTHVSAGAAPRCPSAYGVLFI